MTVLSGVEVVAESIAGRSFLKMASLAFSYALLSF